MGSFIPWSLFSNFIDVNFPKNHHFLHITLLIDNEIPISNCRPYGRNQYVLELDARDQATMLKDENNALRYIDFITKEDIIQISSDYEYLYTIPYGGGTKFNIIGFKMEV